MLCFKSKAESGNVEHSVPDTITETKAEVHHLPRPDPIIDATDLSDTTESEAEKHACKFLIVILFVKFFFNNFSATEKYNIFEHNIFMSS